MDKWYRTYQSRLRWNPSFREEYLQVSQACPEPEGNSSELEAQVPLETGQEIEVSTGGLVKVPPHIQQDTYSSPVLVHH